LPHPGHAGDQDDLAPGRHLTRSHPAGNDARGTYQMIPEFDQRLVDLFDSDQSRGVHPRRRRAVMTTFARSLATHGCAAMKSVECKALTAFVRVEKYAI